MGSEKVQIMVAITLFLLGLRFFVDVILDFSDQSIVKWVYSIGYNLLDSLIFLIAIATAIILIKDALNEE